MATIQSQLRLNDGMSGVLRSVTAALDTCLSSFERMQAASGQAMDVGNITAARVALSDANATVEAIEQSYRRVEDQQRRVERQQEDVNRSIRDGGNAVDGLARKIGSFVAAYASVQGIKQLFSLSDSVASTQARLSLIVGTDNVALAQQQIMDMANRTRAGFQSTADAVTKLGINAGKSFSGFDEIVRFTELMNKNFIIGGASIQEQTAAMYQLTQAMAAGRLQGDEFRSIVENAPLLANAITEYMQNAGVSGTLKEWSADGLLTADVIKNALFSTTDEINAQFEAMPMTWGQVWERFKNDSISALQPLLTQISKMANNENVQTAFRTLIKIIQQFASIALVALNAVGAMLGILGGGFNGLARVIAIVVASYLAFNLALKIYNGLVKLSAFLVAAKNIVTQIMAATESRLTMAIAAAAIAQKIHNAAMAAFPGMAFVMVLGLVIGGLSALFSSSEKAESAMDDVTSSVKSLENELTQNLKTIESTRAQSEAAGEKAVLLANEFYELATAANQSQSDIDNMQGILMQLQEIMPELNISEDILNNATAFSSMAEAIRDVSDAFKEYNLNNMWADVYGERITAQMATAAETEDTITTMKEGFDAYKDNGDLYRAFGSGWDHQGRLFWDGYGGMDAFSDIPETPEWREAFIQEQLAPYQQLLDDTNAGIKDDFEKLNEFNMLAMGSQSTLDNLINNFNASFSVPVDPIATLQASIRETAAESMGAAATAVYLADAYTQLYNSGDKSNGALSRMGAIVSEINGIIPNLNAEFNATTGAVYGIEGSLNSAASAFYRYAEAQAFAAAYRDELQNAATRLIQADLTYRDVTEGVGDHYALKGAAIDRDLAQSTAKSEIDYLMDGWAEWQAVVNSFGNIYEQQTANNTSRMADSLDVSKEELKYLRDIAEREAINRFTTAEIKVDMTGMTNRIDSELDIDGVINRFMEGVTEAVSTDMEGVGAA